jgi:hypothetical protein
MDATISHDGGHFRSGEDFVISDLSVGGVGFVIPRRVGRSRNPLLGLRIDDQMDLELCLAVIGDPEPTVVHCVLSVVRLNPAYNSICVYAGIRMASIDHEAEMRLGRFIARAQVACRSGREN